MSDQLGTIWGGECKGEFGCAAMARPINQWRALTELTTREQTLPKPRQPHHYNLEAV